MWSCREFHRNVHMWVAYANVHFSRFYFWPRKRHRSVEVCCLRQELWLAPISLQFAEKGSIYVANFLLKNVKFVVDRFHVEGHTEQDILSSVVSHLVLLILQEDDIIHFTTILLKSGKRTQSVPSSRSSGWTSTNLSCVTWSSIDLTFFCT